MTTTDLWRVDRETELLMEIGRVTVRWAALDKLLEQAACIALDNHLLARALISDANNAGQQRITTFNRIVENSRLSEAERKELTDLVGQFKMHLRTRNEIVHSPISWGITLDGRSIRHDLQRIGKGGERHDVSIQDIREHTKIIDDLLTRLEDMLGRLDLIYYPLEEDSY